MSEINKLNEETLNAFEKVVEERHELRLQLQYLKEENNNLKEALRWYVDNDDTMNTEYNAPWLKGKYRAMKLLGIHEDDEEPDAAPDAAHKSAIKKETKEPKKEFSVCPGCCWSDGLDNDGNGNWMCHRCGDEWEE